jgi:hypothetical protein
MCGPGKDVVAKSPLAFGERATGSLVSMRASAFVTA